MKNILLLTVFLVLGVAAAYAQACAPCNIDSVALSPASNYPSGALYPDPFPSVTQGVPYDTSITYVMPKTYDTGIIGVVNVDQVQVVSISGLPAGLQWSCNVPNCIFYPQVSQYGCVRVCGTSFATPGIYPLTITVLGTAVGQSQPITFNLDVTVLPGSVSTGSFTAVNTSGCDSVTASFEALIDGAPSPTTYSWDFGNGTTSTAKVPPVQTYTTPGVYPVTLETTIGNLRLTDLSLSSVNENWENTVTECNDVVPGLNIPLCTNNAPDLLIRVYDANSTLVYTTSEKSNQNPPVNWTGISVDITNGPYTIQIYDIDVVGEDFIGTFSLTNLTPGTHNFSGNLTSGSYTLVYVPTVTYNDTVNVEVYATPADPVIGNLSGNSVFCAGDSIVLSSSPADTYQWTLNGTDILDATDSTLVVTESGVYGVKITVGQGNCVAASVYTDSVIVSPLPPVPNVQYVAATNRLGTSNGANYDRQWYFNGQPIPNATDVYYNNPQAGSYQLELTNSSGCKRMSPPFAFTAIAQLGGDALDFNMYPNPVANQLNLTLPQANGIAVSIMLFDMVGRQVLVHEPTAGTNNVTFDVSHLNNGVYMLQVEMGSQKGIQRLVVQH